MRKSVPWLFKGRRAAHNLLLHPRGDGLVDRAAAEDSRG